MTDELKKAIESALTDDQKKEVAEKFKDEIQKLSQEELDEIAGGGSFWNKPINPPRYAGHGGSGEW